MLDNALMSIKGISQRHTAAAAQASVSLGACRLQLADAGPEQPGNLPRPVQACAPLH